MKDIVLLIRSNVEQFTIYFKTSRSARMHARKIQKLLNNSSSDCIVNVGKRKEFIGLKRSEINSIFETIKDSIE